MGVDRKIAENLFTKCPQVIKRGLTRMPLHVGDLVSDQAYIDMPRRPDDGVGRIMSIKGSSVVVQWRDGDISKVRINAIARIQDEYEPEIYEAAYQVPKFVTGTNVVLGNGDHGKILEEVVGPTGFKSFRVQITSSVNKMTVGRRVFATPSGMLRVAGLAPEAIVGVYSDGQLVPKIVLGVELAADEEDQIIGLQKYSSLPDDHGMLFPYNPAKRVMFHMGSVSFPIDVVFIDNHGRITAIEENKSPGSNERWSHGRVAAVLETNGGWCNLSGVLVGDLVRVRSTKVSQEHFDPSRSDVEPRTPTDINKLGPDRFKDHSLPDDYFHFDDHLNHFDESNGYDVMKYHDDPDAPAIRPAASKKR